MSSIPVPYTRQSSFTGYHVPERPTLGQDLEAEFNAVKQSQDQTQSRLSEIQRDDGKLRNLSVHPDALSQAVRALLAMQSGEIKGQWVTGLVYDKGDVIEAPDLITYIAVFDHVAGASFSVDQVAGKWIAIDSGLALDATLRADFANPVSPKGAELIGYTPTSTGTPGTLRSFLELLYTGGNASGAALLRYLQTGTGAVARTVQAKLREHPTVTDFGAVGDGSTNDQTAFDNALALAQPIEVPYSAQFYVLSTLTDAQRALLWGAGRVKVAGTDTAIPSQPRAFPNDIPGRAVRKPTWQPTQYPGTAGSIGNGTTDDVVTRTGGFGSYGVDMTRVLVTAAVPAGQFDVGTTTWVTATNLTGGQTFASWFGANTPAKNLGQTYSSGAVIGVEVNVGNRWADFGLQDDLGGTRYTVGMQIVPDVLPAVDGVNTIDVTSISVASPGVVTLNSHGLVAHMGVVFNGAGTLPTGLVKGQPYYVSASGLTANTFQVAAAPGGASINTTGSFVAPINILPSWASTFGAAASGSVWGHRWWTVTLIRPDTVMPGGYMHRAHGGSSAGQAPAAWTKLSGFFARGLDARATAFANYPIDLDGASYLAAINFDFSSVVTAATGGGFTLPANPAGFIKHAINGNLKAVPYYNLP